VEVWVFGWMGMIDEERGKYAQNMVHIGLNKLFGGQHKK